MTSMMAMRRWLSAVVRMRSTPLRGNKNRRGVTGRGVIDDVVQIELRVRLPVRL